MGLGPSPFPRKASGRGAWINRREWNPGPLVRAGSGRFGGLRPRRSPVVAVWAAALGGVLGWVQPATGHQVQSLSLDSVLTARRIPMTHSPTESGGPGFDVIVRAAADARFVMVGESHNLAHLPEFTSHLFDALHQEHGYRYLVMEDGPRAIEMLMAPGVRGDRAASVEWANRYVSALQFRNDQEIDLIAHVGRVSTAPTEPVWGIDNAWGVQHIADALIDLAPDPAAEELARALADSAAVYEAFRPSETRPRFIVSVLTEEVISALEEAFDGTGPEAQALLRSLRVGYETYAARRDRPSIYSANDLRERRMRSRFMEKYRPAVAAGEQQPRAVLKFGQVHAISGPLSPTTSVASIGTFLEEFARSEGSEMINIWTALINEPGDVWTLHDFPAYAPLAAAGTTDGWWVIDLRPVRPLLNAGLFEGVSPEVEEVIYGFDFALLTGSGRRGTFERVVRR